MQVVETLADLRAELGRWRQQNQSIALVPTMGNLHRGHLCLITEARRRAQKIVATIFVNPTQFDEGEDFASYPRTLDEDAQKLRSQSTDLLFVPSVEQIYPRIPCTTVEVPGLSDELCGQFRPQHFAGVTTIVCKLFNMVQPDLGFFGEKDFQQLILIRRMVADLDIPVEIIGVPTVRESSGLALSSRNAYLSPSEHKRAPVLFQTLCDARRDMENGRRDFRNLEDELLERLRMVGFKPDYFSIRCVSDLVLAEPDDRTLVVLAAAWLGKARLIDNIQVNLDK